METEETPQEMFDRLKRERKEREVQEPKQPESIVGVICIVLVIGSLIIAFIGSKQSQKEYGLFKSMTQSQSMGKK